MRFILSVLLLGLAQPVLAQQAPAEEEIVVRGLADGARVVEVDFDKVWKSCAECKRALKKLDKLAQAYRDEREAAAYAAQRPGAPKETLPISGVGTFAASSAQNTADWQAQARRHAGDVKDQLDSERLADQGARLERELNERFVRPELIDLTRLTRSFLEQLAPHVQEATEAERVAHGANAGLTDRKRTKLEAKNLTRIDVTAAVIRRLDAMDFTVQLPEPRKSPARKN